MRGKIKSLAVLGGDKRQTELANYLFNKGYKICACGLEKAEGLNNNIDTVLSIKAAAEKSDAILLPMPASEDNRTIFSPLSDGRFYLAEVFGALKPAQPILGGRISKKIIDLASDRKIKVIDYFENNDLKIKNAVTTAEGAIAIAIENTDISIFDSNCLICGFGRIGKHLANKLDALDANVTVSARRIEDIAYIESFGYKSVHTDNLKSCIKDADIVFNTIPAMVIDKKILGKMKESALIIDLASIPGGVDFEAAKERKIKTIHALSLPSRYSPKTAARHIGETLTGILEELI